jgi:hypothetical protein
MAKKEPMDDDLKDAVDEATGLVSMKRTKAELKEEKERWKECGPSNGDAYPYGLELRLENASLEKLGIDSLPAVGKLITIQAVAIVEAASQSESIDKDGKKRPAERHLTLQIQKLKLSKGSKA